MKLKSEKPSAKSVNSIPFHLSLLKKPTLEMLFLVNNSPFADDGEPVTSRKFLARLLKETESDIAPSNQ